MYFEKKSSQILRGILNSCFLVTSNYITRLNINSSSDFFPQKKVQLPPKPQQKQTTSHHEFDKDHLYLLPETSYLPVFQVLLLLVPGRAPSYHPRKKKVTTMHSSSEICDSKFPGISWEFGTWMCQEVRIKG